MKYKIRYHYEGRIIGQFSAGTAKTLREAKRKTAALRMQHFIESAGWGLKPKTILCIFKYNKLIGIHDLILEQILPKEAKEKCSRLYLDNGIRVKKKIYLYIDKGEIK